MSRELIFWVLPIATTRCSKGFSSPKTPGLEELSSPSCGPSCSAAQGLLGMAGRGHTYVLGRWMPRTPWRHRIQPRVMYRKEWIPDFLTQNVGLIGYVYSEPEPRGDVFESLDRQRIDRD